jgi:hypothetical protein
MLRTVKLYEQLSLFESSSDFKSELEGLRDYLVKAKETLDQQVVDLCKNLYAQLTSEKLPNKQGFLTGMHQWWKNLWGRNDKQNPYYWQNRIGALGRTDIDPPTVEEYRMLNALAQELSEAVESSRTPLINKILTQWSGKLRTVVGNYMDDMISRVSKVAGLPMPAAPIATPPTATLPVEKPKEEEPTDPKAAIKAAWDKIKDFADKKQRQTFLSKANGKDPKAAIEYADLLLYMREQDPAKESPEEPDTGRDDSRLRTHRMGDIEGDGGEEDDAPATTPKKVNSSKSLDDEAREIGIEPDTKTTFGIFKNLTDDLKTVVINACRSSSGKDCPVVEKTPEPKTPEEEILSKLTSVEIHNILRKYDGKSVQNIHSGREKIDDHDRAVILAVNQPWLSLTPGERKYHNDQGSLNRPLRSHNRVVNGVTLPFRIPPVIRMEDPRYQILRDYYPEHFKKLNGVGRVERENDTPETLEKRIKRNIRTGKVSGEFSDEKPEAEGSTPKKTAPVPNPTADPEPDKAPKKKKLTTSRMGALPDDTEDVKESIKDVVKGFPKGIAAPIVTLASEDEEKAREVAKAWLEVKKGERQDKKRFEEYLEAKEWDEAIAMASDQEDDSDEIRDMMSHYKPEGPSLLEAFKTRLRLQREGKFAPWQPMPKKVTPSILIERLKKQSKEMYQKS